jgi:predicted TIM-barrel enzyme
MMRTPSRDEILSKLHAKIAAGLPVIGGGAGTGISAKSEAAGGIDLIVIYNSGRYRMAGRGSLAGLMPYGDANSVVMEMADEVLPVAGDTPVLAGVCASDPFRDLDRFLDRIKERGFAGVQNFPTVGLIDGTFRAGLEETGMGYAAEIDLVRKARARDMLTTPYVFDTEQAAEMTRAGADIVVCHLGLTTSGAIGAQTSKTLEESATLINAWTDAARKVRDEVIVLCHGGPIAMPEDAQFIMEACPGVAGFYGASSMERLPVEQAVRAQVEAFRQIGRK